MVHDIYYCGVKGGRDLVYIDVKGMWNYIILLDI